MTIAARLDRRVLAAVRFVDAATGAPVDRALHVTSAARTYRQRSGLLVIADVPELHEHALAFAHAPAEPAVGTIPVVLSVSDPAREYQSTTVTIDLPREPANGQENSVFEAHRVNLWRTGAAPVSGSWTVFRATLVDRGTENPVIGALVSLRTTGQTVHALSDATGQAALTLVGIPLFALVDGRLTRRLAAKIEVRRSDVNRGSVDVEAEIARLAARPVSASFDRDVLTGAASHEVLEIGP